MLLKILCSIKIAPKPLQLMSSMFLSTSKGANNPKPILSRTRAYRIASNSRGVTWTLPWLPFVLVLASIAFKSASVFASFGLGRADQFDPIQQFGFDLRHDGGQIEGQVRLNRNVDVAVPFVVWVNVNKESVLGWIDQVPPFQIRLVSRDFWIVFWNADLIHRDRMQIIVERIALLAGFPQRLWQDSLSWHISCRACN